MSELNVAFVVKDDIINKIRAYPETKRKDFVLGLHDDDYFGKHFVAIEEISETHEMVFVHFLDQIKELRYMIQSCEILFDSKSSGLIVLMDKDCIQWLLQAMEGIHYTRYVECYDFFLSDYGKEENSLPFMDFLNYLDTFRNLVFEAIRKDGSLLFFIDTSDTISYPGMRA